MLQLSNLGHSSENLALEDGYLIFQLLALWNDMLLYDVLCNYLFLFIFLFQVWNVSSGFCFVTFPEHTSAVTALHFMANNHCLLSASKDGTVRAWDLFRYRNFRTFTTPSSRQFLSLTADQSGEVICAGTDDTFEVHFIVLPSLFLFGGIGLQLVQLIIFCFVSTSDFCVVNEDRALA